MLSFKEFEKRNQIFHVYFCGIKKPALLGLATGFIYTCLFLLHLVIYEALEGLHGNLATQYLFFSFIGHTFFLALLLAFLFKKGRYEFFNLNFHLDLKYNIITGFIFSLFFVLLAVFVVINADAKTFLMNSYKQSLQDNIGVSTDFAKLAYSLNMILGSIFEEIIYRAILFKALARKIPIGLANVLITVLFIFVHLIFHEFLVLSIAGWASLSLACGIAFGKTNCWVAPAVVHLVYNSRFYIVAPFLI